MKLGTLWPVGLLVGLGVALLGCPSTAPVTMRVVTTPYAVPNAGGTTIAYEILLSDYRTDDLTLTKVEVFADGKRFRTFTKDELLKEDYTKPALLVLPEEGAAAKDAAPEDLMACTQPVLYFGIRLEEGEAIPTSIWHKLHFVDRFWRCSLVTGAAAQLSTEPLMTIAPPLRGDRMAALESLAPSTHHRKGLLMFDGEPYISQRFAIDWVRLTETGTMSDGSSTGNTAYPGYGEDLLAVAPGTVVKITQGVPDNQTPPGRDVAMTNDTLGGNLIVIQIAENRYAFYGHCIPGSILVEEGDEVVAGQLLAHMGNSGNSDLPHLHFQIADNVSLLEAQGIPYVIDQFTHDADFRYWMDDGEPFQSYVTEFAWTPLDEAVACSAEFIANGMVVTFK